jgi:hypothetical protein
MVFAQIYGMSVVAAAFYQLSQLDPNLNTNYPSLRSTTHDI